MASRREDPPTIHSIGTGQRYYCNRTALTELQVNGKSAWTCGLEVDGPPSTLVEAFQRVETMLLDEAFPLSLSATVSMGYVAWLGKSFDIRPHSAVTVGFSEF